MHKSLLHHCGSSVLKYCRTLVFLALISFFATSARATCNAAWTYTISGDTIFLQSTDTASANHHYWSFNGVYNTSNQTSLMHVYTGPGTYHICQYVYTPGTNCSDSSCVNVTIQATTPPCNLNTAWTYVIHGDSIVVTTADTSTVTHHYWTASSTTTYYTGLTATFVFPNYGIYRICLHEYVPNTSCADSNCQSITLAAPCNVHAAWQSYNVGDTTHFFASGNTGTVYYNWHYGDGTTGTGASPLHSYAQAGTYHVCLYAYTGSNCIDSLCQTVTVTYHAPCQITAAWTSHSHGDTVYFTAADTNSATHHFWNFGDGSAIGTGSTATHVYANAGTYHVCFYDYIPNTTCIDSFCQNVSVTVLTCHVSAAWTYTIHGDTVFLHSTDTSSANNHYWTFGGTSYTSGINVIHVYPNYGINRICLHVYTPGTNCVDSSCNTITIPYPCTLTYAWTFTAHGDSVTFQAHDTASAVHHYWTFGDGTAVTTGIDPLHVYAAAGTYHVCLHEYIPNTNCADSFCSTITVGTTCHVSAVWQSSTHGDTAHFYSGTNTGTVYYNWHYGDGTSGSTANPTHVYAQAGTYHVCLYVYSSTYCVDSFCNTVTVGTGCHISAAWTYTLHGDTVILYSADTASANHHNWVFDGSTANYAQGTTVTHIFTTAGIHHICLYVYTPGTSCFDSSCNNITIVNPCNVHAAWQSYTVGDTAHFFAGGNTGASVYYVWHYGDGQSGTGATATHLYTQAGTYHVCLYAYAGTNCVDSFCNTVTVGTGCHVSAAWSYSIHGDTVFLHSNDTSSVNHHYWLFNGNTSTYTSGTNVIHVYTGPGTYHICLYVYTPGTTCSDSSCNNITITSPCNISAAWQSYSVGDTAHFFAGSNTGTVYYNWNYGDGQTGTGSTSTHLYAQAGTYHVCLYAYSGTNCIDSFCNTITVGSGCHVSAAWTYTVHGDTVYLQSTDTSSANHHYWIFNGNTSNYASGTSVTHVYTGSGTYHICLYVYTPGTTCSDSSCNNITISTTCTAHAAWQSYSVGDTAHFFAGTNSSNLTYTWNFGDGHTGTGYNPLHTYLQPGTYYVCLLVVQANTGCRDSFCNTITVGTGCHISAAWTYTLHGDTVILQSADTASANHHFWVFDGSTANYANGTHIIHVFTTAGIHHICLYVYTPGTTCSDSSCNNITIVNPCTANAAWTSHDHGDTIFFAAADTNSAVYMDWNFGDGTYGFGQYPIHVYSQPGTYHVCLYAYTSSTCVDSFCNTITVSSGCHISAAWTYTLHGDTIVLQSADTASANHHYWVFDGSTNNYASGTTVAHIFTAVGVHHICLFVYTPGTNCIDSSCNNITIVSPCNVNAAWQSYSIGDSAHFFAGGNTGTVYYNWSFGDGHSGTGNNPLHVYAQAGTYYVCLRAYTGSNCIDSFCNTITIASGCQISSQWTYDAFGDSLHFFSADTNHAAHHYWNFGDGHTGSGFDVSHVYSAPGVYHACSYVYIPGTNCIDSTCNDVIVTGTCGVTAAMNFINISHDTVAFYTLFQDSAANVEWIYGDGTTGSGTYSVHGYPAPGTYNVCVHVFIPGTPCSDSVCIQINVGAACAVTAEWASISRGNDSLQFYALDPDTNAVHNWTFGDGSTASGSYAAHTYASSGTYHVCLYVYVPNTTCSDSICKDVNSVLGITDPGIYPTISLSPNPFSQYAVMNIDGPASTYEVRIYDMLGQQVRTVVGVNKSIMIERGNLASGIYTYAVMTGNVVIGKGKMSIE